MVMTEKFKITLLVRNDSEWPLYPNQAYDWSGMFNYFNNIDPYNNDEIFKAELIGLKEITEDDWEWEKI
tara:strand:+ start:223 stop:429 length:207 start_codon:yes stop_codon:yes gene_type:complete